MSYTVEYCQSLGRTRHYDGLQSLHKVISFVVVMNKISVVSVNFGTHFFVLLRSHFAHYKHVFCRNNIYSQERVAELSGCHSTYIGQVERGEKNATLESVARISTALNIPLAKLFDKIEGNSQNDIPSKCYEFLLSKSKADYSGALAHPGRSSAHPDRSSDHLARSALQSISAADQHTR